MHSLLVYEETTFCLKIPHGTRQTKIPITSEAVCNQLAASGGQSNEPQARPHAPASQGQSHPQNRPHLCRHHFCARLGPKQTNKQTNNNKKKDKTRLFSSSLYLNKKDSGVPTPNSRRRWGGPGHFGKYWRQGSAHHHLQSNTFVKQKLPIDGKRVTFSIRRQEQKRLSEGDPSGATHVGEWAASAPPSPFCRALY